MHLSKFKPRVLSPDPAWSSLRSLDSPPDAVTPIFDAFGLVCRAGQGAGWQYRHPGGDPGDRLELTDEVVGQVLIGAIETVCAFHLDREVVEVVDPLHHKAVFASQIVVLAGDGLDVAWEDVDPFDDEHVIDPAVHARHPNGCAAAATGFVRQAD